MTDIKALIERLEAADGPDRELDLAVLCAVPAPVCGWVVVWPDHLSWNSLDAGHRAPPLTASLDAAVAFAERVLPGCYVRTEPRFHIDGERVDFVSWALRPRWSDWRPDDEWFDRGEGRHAKQVLSILIAVLRALQAQGGSDG